jgi:hypothetical protein
MKRKKLWLFVLIVGIMTLSTVLYVTMLRNARTSYANGRFVWQEDTGYEVGYYLRETGTK